MKVYIVKREEVGLRLDKYLSKQEEILSRVMVQRQIENEKVKINGKIQTKASYKTEVNDRIEIEEIENKEVDIKPQDIPLDVLYEDRDIIVLNKQKGMVVHPANGNQEGTLVNAIMARCGDSLSGIGGEIRPGIIHRLDKDTSGVIIVAKNDLAHTTISEQIKNRKTTKIYIALVRGRIKEKEATINMPIGRSTKDRKKMAVTKNGKEAITNIKVLKRYESYTLVEIQIKTGRTHQIRVHLAEIGYPIIGDYTYSKGKNEFGVVGQMLHAKSIIFIHPKTKKEIKIEAPLPKYFEEVLEQIKDKVEE